MASEVKVFALGGRAFLQLGAMTVPVDAIDGIHRAHNSRDRVVVKGVDYHLEVSTSQLLRDLVRNAD